MRIITVANQKGGCGKTTIVINLGACMAREGRRTLVIDMDPQSHCALGLAVPEEQIEQSVTSALLSLHDGKSPDLSRITWQISNNFDLIPSKFDLSTLEQRLAGVTDRASLLRKVIAALTTQYDFVLVDTPPTVGFLTENALHAADEVVVPVDTGYFSLQGLSKQLESVRMLRAGCGRSLSVRILANLYDVRTKLGREILAELRKRHGDAMYKSFINFNTKLKESSSLGQPITEYDPSSSGCRDFVRLAREIIALAPGSSPSVPSDLLAQADALAADANKLLATSQTLLGKPRVPQIAAAAAVPTPAEIDRKIAAIYGASVSESGITFVVRAPGARAVRLAGDFNDWQPDRTPMESVRPDTFQTRLPLGPGRYRYRYVIDGQWRSDPANLNAEVNPFGELNSVVEVG